MSTRCQIGFYQDAEAPIKDFDALIYRHSDGYPSGVLPDIMPFLAWWAKGRGIADTEYVSARLLQYLCNAYDKHTMGFNKEFAEKGTTNENMRKMYEEEIADTEQFTGKLGHGICKMFHWDIEYFYAVTPRGVKVYEVQDVEKMSFTELGVVPFENYEADATYQKLIQE